MLTQGQIEGLPLNGRNFLELAKLEPGTQPPDPVAGRGQADRGQVDIVLIADTDRDTAIDAADPVEIAQVTPSSGAQGVAPTATVRAVFTKPIDPLTLTSDTFYLTGPSGFVNATIAYDAPTGNGVPGAVRWRWPITSSRLRGRIRTASGAAAWVARSSASSNKLATEASLLGRGTAKCAVRPKTKL